jgi:EAL domain-containing protein (putative c-di-GMP-specific phosphodiesterase class I)
VARWGGDEFAVLVTGALSEADLVALAERLAGQISGEPFSTGGTDVALRVSVGAALARSDADVKDLLQRADVAMTKAKSAAGGRVELFAEPMITEARLRRELAEELAQAIAEHQLEIWYQPIADLATEQVVAVEAMAGWQRGGAAVEPGELSSVAEEAGLSVALGSYLIKEACRQVAAWRASGWPIGLTVSVSQRQASVPGFADKVLAAVRQAGLEPGVLTVALAEHGLADASRPDFLNVPALRNQGIRFAIDHVGAGNAALARIGDLAPDAVRIDPLYIGGVGTDQAHTSLVHAIVGFCRDLGIEVVACGVEHAGQLSQLNTMGCGQGQGAAVGQPAAAAAVAGLAPATLRAATPAQAT